MQIKETNIECLSKEENLSLSPSFNLRYSKFYEEYQKLSKTGDDRKRLKDIIKVITPKKVKKGNLLTHKTMFQDLRIWIADEDIENTKNISILQITEKEVTEKYLLNYLSRNEIKNYLSLFVRGSTIKYLPLRAVLNLYAPIGSDKIQYGVSSFEMGDISSHQEIMNILLEEYKKVEKDDLELSSVVLAGSICENILIREILENGVKEKHLNKYGGLGNLIALAGIENIFPEGKEKEFEEHFNNIRQARNLIHSKKLLEKIREKERLVETSKKSFSQILKEYNISG